MFGDYNLKLSDWPEFVCKILFVLIVYTLKVWANVKITILHDV